MGDRESNYARLAQDARTQSGTIHGLLHRVRDLELQLAERACPDDPEEIGVTTSDDGGAW